MSVEDRKQIWKWSVTGGAVVLLLVTLTAGQDKSKEGSFAAARKISNAMSAAPSEVASKATIMDWPSKEGAHHSVLRQGSNGWVCYPDYPDTKGNDPMCLDDAWQKWMEAYMAQKPPEVAHVGISYMIAPGGAWSSNTDPFATAEEPDNQWGFDGPHLMIVVPDTGALKGLPTDRKSGGPFVMYAGTPYAHIMVPTISPSGSASKTKQ